MTTRRLFFALWPDNRQRDQLRDVINSVAKTVEGKAVDRRLWHATLAYIGDFDERRIPELRSLVSGVRMAPFRLGFDRLEFWARPRMACLVAATVPIELESLVASLHRVIAEVGVMPEDRSFRPHITVSHGARSFTTVRLTQRMMTEWSGFELMESVSGPGGVNYVPLKQ